MHKVHWLYLAAELLPMTMHGWCRVHKEKKYLGSLSWQGVLIGPTAWPAEPEAYEILQV